MRDLSDKELEKYADKIRRDLQDLTPFEKQKVFQKMGRNPRREEDGLFSEIDFDVDLDGL
jgi:hypothetical protein